MNKLKVLVLASLVAMVAFTGCQNPINPGQGGTLTVSMNDAVSRSILPGISMNPASYNVVGTGPNSASFSQTVTNDSNATITGLAFGEWIVTATAKNSNGTAIGQGSGTVTVMSNASVSLSITVRPYDGFGTLSLTVSWPAAQVQTAQIQSTLTPASGSARDLSFAVNGSAGTASFSASDVATGYHTLILKLLDNGHLAIGAVEVVRIVKDQTTSGTLHFANVNQATGTLEVNLTPEMGDPLEVSISGSTATKPANQSLALSAAVSNYADNVTYVWYVNGEAKATGYSYSFDNTWAQGYYRIDITAFSADGKRAGSATTNIQVTSNGPDSNLVVNGLQVYLDANSTTSYPGAGQVWYDLSGQGNDFYLGKNNTAEAIDPVFVNGAFDMNQHFFTKKDSNGVYVNSIHKPNAKFTIEIWTYVPSTWQGYVIGLGTTDNIGGNGFRWFLQGPWGFNIYNNAKNVFAYNDKFGSPQIFQPFPTPTQGFWQQSVVSIDTTMRSGFVAVNGQYVKIDNADTFSFAEWGQTTQDAPNLLRIGTQTNDGAPLRGSGSRIAILRMYDRALSLSEVQSNFAFDKSRFNL